MPFYQQALEIRRELSRAHPENRQYTLDLVKALLTLGTIQRHLGNADAARKLFADAQKALRKPLESAPGDPALQVQLAAALAGEAAAYADLAQPEKARGLLEDAAATVSQAAGPRGTRQTSWRSNDSGAARRSGTLLACLRDLKQPQEAELALSRTNRAVEKATARGTPRPRDQAFDRSHHDRLRKDALSGPSGGRSRARPEAGRRLT